MREISKTAPDVTAPAPRPRRRGLLVAPVLIFAALVAMFAFALRKGDPSRLPSVLIGRPAPAIALAPLQGLTGKGGQPVPGIDADALETGRVSVVNFWASWCVPCVDELPMLARLAQRSDVTVLGVNYKDQTANALRFLSSHGNPYAVVGVDADGRMAIDWGVTGMPETFVVDGRGTVVSKHIGQITPAALEATIIPAIRAAARSD